MIEAPREPIIRSPHARVAFGAGSLRRMRELLDEVSMTNVLVVTTHGRERTAGVDFGLPVAAIAREHVPVEVIRQALVEVDRHGAHAVLAFGGGSAIGLAKAIALERSLPVAAIPTTYAGSEMTGIWGVTEGAIKRTGRDSRVAPRLVIYDPTLTLTLPPDVSAASGMNAIAHAVEAMYAPNVSVEVKEGALGAIRLLASSLPVILTTPGDLNARTAAMAGAQAAGVSLELAAMGLHHKICHVLGGTFGLPHALTHAVVLPHVVEFNTPPAHEAMGQVAAAIGAQDAATGLKELTRTLGLPQSLTDIGFSKTEIPLAAELVTSASYPNPRQVSDQDVRKILIRATGS